MSLINEAYHVLSNVQKRYEYDRTNNWPKPRTSSRSRPKQYQTHYNRTTQQDFAKTSKSTPRAQPKNKNITLVSVMSLILLGILVLVFTYQSSSTNSTTSTPTDSTLGASDKTNEYYFTSKADSEPTTDIGNATCQSSIASNRSDSFRCVGGDAIYDPCFSVVKYESKLVGCPNTPRGKENIFNLSSNNKDRPSGALFKINDNDYDVLPWFIVLFDNSECRYITGASRVVADKRIDYVCSDNQTHLQLPVEKNGEISRIRCYNPSKSAIELCPIKELWF